MNGKPPISKKFFMMRIDPEVAFAAKMAALKSKKPLRTWIENVITKEILKHNRIRIGNAE